MFRSVFFGQNEVMAIDEEVIVDLAVLEIMFDQPGETGSAEVVSWHDNESDARQDASRRNVENTDSDRIFRAVRSENGLFVSITDESLYHSRGAEEA